MLKNLENEAELDALEAQTEKPVVLQFSAAWCGPCKVLKPVVEKVASETDAAEFRYVDVDKFPDIAGKFGVMAVPTLALLKAGQKPKLRTGGGSEADIKAFAEA